MTRVLDGAVWHVDAARAMGGRLIDLSGNERHAVFGEGDAAPLVLPWDGEDYVYLPQNGAAQNLLYGVSESTRDAQTSAGIAIDVRLDEWEAEDSYAMLVYGGDLRMYTNKNGVLVASPFSEGGTFAAYNFPEPLVAGERARWAFTIDATTVTFYKNGTEIGTAPVTQEWRGTYANAVAGVQVGYNSRRWNGACWYASRMIDGQTSLVFDAERLAAGDFDNPGEHPGSIEVRRADAGFKTAVVDRPMLLLGGGQSAEVGGDGMQNVGQDAYTVLAATRTFWTSGVGSNNQTLFATKDVNISGGDDGILLRRQGVNLATQHCIRYSTGSPTGYRNSTSVPPHPEVRWQRRQADGMWDNDAIPVAITTSDAPGSGPLTVGSTVGGTSSCWEGEFLAAAIFDRSLTDTEVAQASRELLELPTGLPPFAAPPPAPTLSPDDPILRGPRATRFRFELLGPVIDDNGDRVPEAELGELHGAVGGSLEWKLTSGVKGGGSLELRSIPEARDIDWLNHRIRPVVLIDDAHGSTVAERPLGVFVAAAPKEKWTSTGRLWEVELLDKSSLLNQDIPTDWDGNPVSYSLLAGTNVVEAVTALIGFINEQDSVLIEPSDDVLTQNMVWDAGTPLLTIINNVLSAANYFSLWCDGLGRFRTGPYVPQTERGVIYSSSPPLVPGSYSVRSADWELDRDIYEVPNRMVALSTATEAEESFTAVEVNLDPDSPFSYPARGRWITVVDQGVDATSQAALQAYCRRRMTMLTSTEMQATIKHLYLPDLAIGAIARFADAEAEIDGLFEVRETTVAFDPLALCTSVIEEVVPDGRTSSP